MQRICEPELMLNAAQVKAYADANLAAEQALFLDVFRQTCQIDKPGRVLDLGCGPGDITLKLAELLSLSTVHGVDGSAAMLAIAETRLGDAKYLQKRVQYFRRVIGRDALPENSYDIVVSNNFLHHLHDPGVLWQVVKELKMPETSVLVMDLVRVDSRETAQHAVDTYLKNEPQLCRIDLFNSLLAAFTPEEVSCQLGEAGIEWLEVTQIDDFHMIIRNK